MSRRKIDYIRRPVTSIGENEVRNGHYSQAFATSMKNTRHDKLHEKKRAVARNSYRGEEPMVFIRVGKLCNRDNCVL